METIRNQLLKHDSNKISKDNRFQTQKVQKKKQNKNTEKNIENKLFEKTKKKHKNIVESLHSFE